MECREKKWRGALLIHWPCFNRPCPVCGLVPAVRTATIDQEMESEGRGVRCTAAADSGGVWGGIIEAVSTRGTLLAPVHQTRRYEPSQGGAYITFTPPAGEDMYCGECRRQTV